MKIKITGAEEIEAKLSQMSDINWDEIWSEQADEMKIKSDAIVPVKTGALRDSVYYEDGEFGYTADYAPDVNYGHRTKSGSFVPGQHFLEEVVNGQEERYKQAVLNQLKENE